MSAEAEESRVGRKTKNPCRQLGKAEEMTDPWIFLFNAQGSGCYNRALGSKLTFTKGAQIAPGLPNTRLEQVEPKCY